MIRQVIKGEAMGAYNNGYSIRRTQVPSLGFEEDAWLDSTRWSKRGWGW
jgi:hypothetical protein